MDPAELGIAASPRALRQEFGSVASILAAGSLLVGSASDESVVTLSTAPPRVTRLPSWSSQSLCRPNQAPFVDLVAAVLVAASILPMDLRRRLAGGSIASGSMACGSMACGSMACGSMACGRI